MKCPWSRFLRGAKCSLRCFCAYLRKREVGVSYLKPTTFGNFVTLEHPGYGTEGCALGSRGVYWTYHNSPVPTYQGTSHETSSWCSDSGVWNPWIDRLRSICPCRLDYGQWRYEGDSCRNHGPKRGAVDQHRSNPGDDRNHPHSSQPLPDTVLVPYGRRNGCQPVDDEARPQLNGPSLRGIHLKPRPIVSFSAR